MKKWLTARPPAETTSDLQTLIDEFVDVYNHRRAHTSILIDDLDIRVVNKTTGELIRQLTLDPTVGYQPRFKTKQDPTH